jgi:hypothetical protein
MDKEMLSELTKLKNSLLSNYYHGQKSCSLTTRQQIDTLFENLKEEITRKVNDIHKQNKDCNTTKRPVIEATSPKEGETIVIIDGKRYLYERSYEREIGPHSYQPGDPPIMTTIYVYSDENGIETQMDTNPATLQRVENKDEIVEFMETNNAGKANIKRETKEKKREEQI